MSIDIWNKINKRIKNNQNVYIIREKKHPVISRLWSLYYHDRLGYYNELNVKRKFSKEISNFYYNTKIISNNKTKLLVYFFFNKLVLVKYFFFYWTYFSAYEKYNGTNVNSVHIRTELFFLFLSNIIFFFKASVTSSFIKVTFNTFKGVQNTLKNLVINQKITFISNKKIKTDFINQPTENYENLFERKKTSLYVNFYKQKQKPQKFKFYLNTIIYNNIVDIVNIVKQQAQTFRVIWYNKIHNTISYNSTSNVILFLRAAKHFNKGRYSRNRQLYRTGVYWCIWLNVVIVYALHYYFYRIVFAFGYLWVPLCLMILVMFSSRLYKYRYYNIKQLIIEFKEFNNFLFFFFLKTHYKYKLWNTNTYTIFINRYKNYIFLLINFLKLKFSNNANISVKKKN